MTLNMSTFALIIMEAASYKDIINAYRIGKLINQT